MLSEIKSTTQVTNIDRVTKPKNLGGVAAGKRLAQLNKKRKEMKETQQNEETQSMNYNEKHSNTQSLNDIKSSFSLTQVLSVISIVVTLAGLYAKRKELMYFFSQRLKQEQLNQSQRLNRNN